MYSAGSVVPLYLRSPVPRKVAGRGDCRTAVEKGEAASSGTICPCTPNCTSNPFRASTDTPSNPGIITGLSCGGGGRFPCGGGRFPCGGGGGFLEESFLAEVVEGFLVEEEGFLVELGPGCWRVLCVRQIVMLSYGTSEVFSGGDSSGARYVGSSRGSPEMNFGDSPSDGSERSSVGSLNAWEVTKGDSVYRNFLHRSFPDRLASSSLHILPVVSPR